MSEDRPRLRQRSVSLVLSGETWRKSPSPAPTPQLSRTAPTTPTRELLRGKDGRYWSTPDLEPLPPSGDSPTDLSRDCNHNEEVKLQNESDAISLYSESGYDKCRKSFTQKSHQQKEDDSTQPPPFKEGPEKFRLSWRSSKERRKKAGGGSGSGREGRESKCNSGDSGIQVELPGSSDDSPTLRSRRGTGSSTDSRPPRPTSELLNHCLIDRLKRELSSSRQGRGVRRTHSDLGGQRLYNWEQKRGFRRMISHPSPIKPRPSRPLARGARAQDGLRRSVSQPLGLNEISPLLIRKVLNKCTASEEDRPPTSEDEALSDSSSLASLTDRKSSLDGETSQERGALAEAVWDHIAMEAEELGFKAGDVVRVLDRGDRDWWWGEAGGRAGWFPSLFVRMKVGQASGEQASSRKLSETEVRCRVVSELVSTERDFVSVLQHLHDGYLLEARKRQDLLSDEEIDRIFCNLPQILQFQRVFLKDLEDSIDMTNIARSKISPVFLKHLSGFRLYSEYCNGHSRGVGTLEEVSGRPGVGRFWEACRLMRGLMELPLSGYLLTPVQRICKYPLQLAELLKYTKTDHEDYEGLMEAVEGMRGVAFLINERKRRMESLEKVVLWQRRVDAWQGEDLIERSCQLLHQGEVTALKLSSSPGKWSHHVCLFLFDGQLIYCKRDILKRRSYVYKGRMPLDTCEVTDLPDGKVSDSSHGTWSVRHGIKVASGDRWLVFTLRSEGEKSDWLRAFEREREARSDEELFPPHSAREIATIAAYTRHYPSGSKQRSKKRAKPRETGRWFRLGGRKQQHVFPS